MRRKLLPFYNTYQSTAAGAVPELVLLHGWGLHSIAWDDIMPALLASFQVTVIDLPGMGQSPLPNTEYDLNFLTQQVAAVMPEQAHVIGWGLGGLVALNMAAQQPQKILSIATFGTSPKFTAADDWPTAMAPEILEKFAEVLAEDQEGTLIRYLALNCKGSVTQPRDIKVMQEILYFCGLPDPRALAGGFRIMQETDLREVLAQLNVPVLMLFGEHDHIVPAATLGAVKELAPHVEVALLKEVAHVPFISAPELSAQALNDFYATVVR
ncbi:MAG TPA: pimeloyl-ACP methyl ester esterase BioH [Alcanivoracaceae bacterium]|nr:pimeloyl-ACP methyl ester esterase BioH [Alcanivoracaceae bacterium]